MPYFQKGLEILEKKLSIKKTPLKKAFEIYLSIVTIHPFVNGNGRTARLAADWILMSSGYLPVCFDSPIQSHVAVTLNQPLRNREVSYCKFLSAVEKSYEILGLT